MAASSRSLPRRRPAPRIGGRGLATARVTRSFGLFVPTPGRQPDAGSSNPGGVLRTLRTVGFALGMLFLAGSSALAQRQITGRVTDRASGNPIGGSSVNDVGTLASSTTNSERRFTVTAPSGAAQLSVRHIGYRRMVIAAPEGQAEVNVAIDKDVLKLEEVVVTGTATTMERA